MARLYAAWESAVAVACCAMTGPEHRLSRGLFLVFEGIDGAGKTTQVHLLETRLQQEGYPVVCCKEPTTGPWGQKLRHLAAHGRTVEPATELEWFLQDRRDDVAQSILPALERCQIVLLDRYYFSTMAYQGALGISPQDIQARNELFAPPPDLLLLLEVPVAQSLQRVRQRGGRSHFERHAYLTQVAAIFGEMQFPYLTRIDASQAPALVHTCIWQAVVPLLAGTTHAAPRDVTI